VEYAPDATARARRPDVVLFSALITACANAGRCNEALEVLDSMQAGGLQPNHVTYTAVLRCRA
jgi:pentatricopeptide repeat domain-containing protein 1